MFDVAIIGAGASGTLTAVQYGRAAKPGARGALIEAGARAARGLAYGTPYGAHLLNVPASRMSALPDDPEHFVRWLRAHLPGANASTFAPRPLYGAYLSELLHDEAIAAHVERVGGTAIGLTRRESVWLVHLGDGRVLEARNVLLALGNLPPHDPLHLGDDAPVEYVRDPWGAGAVYGLAPDAPVLLVGTGLTMVDLALALRAEGHRGPLIALSRRGRLPRPHATSPPRPIEGTPDLASPRAALRWIRERLAEGHDFRAVVDSLRSHTPAIWQRWSRAQRASFLRHARNLWDVHRSRAAPEVAKAVEEMLASGALRIERGRLVRLTPVDGGLDVTWRRAGSDEETTLRVARAINCTGPATDYARVDLPLVVQLRRNGWLVPDPHGLGVETDPDGRLLDVHGTPVEGLFTLGTLRRPALWESIAIPEIREQAAALARIFAG
ncbi:MAG: FAD/NAD(P)-binding protein [Acidobacteria bacterium]|nr:FAD/NAD(P)-binding protein [Acidobacteriota bacterium]MBV9478835.1 FAD/NAD(P)-binding protein [Acidobacteriota bacterium]